MRGVTVSNAAWSAASAVGGGGPGNRNRASMPSTKGVKSTTIPIAIQMNEAWRGESWRRPSPARGHSVSGNRVGVRAAGKVSA